MGGSVPIIFKGVKVASSLGGKDPEPYKVNNPFWNAERNICLDENGDPKFYMYTHNGKPVYHDPQTCKWHYRPGGQVSNYKIKPAEVPLGEVKNIEIKYFKFEDIFKFKDTGRRIQTDPKIKQQLEDIGVKLGDHIILKDNLFSNFVGDASFGKYVHEKAVLRFVNYKHAKEFFRAVLYTICYGKDSQVISANLMKFYLELLKRFDGKKLELNVKGFVPDKEWVEDKDVMKFVNHREHDVARFFYKILARGYQKVTTEQGYAGRVKAFPELWEYNKGVNVNNWTNPGNKKHFLAFCQNHMSKDDFKHFQDRILLRNFRPRTSKESIDVMFEHQYSPSCTIEFGKNEIQLKGTIYDDVCIMVKEANWFYPAASLKNIRSAIKAWGPLVNESPDKTRRFMDNWAKGKYGKNLIVYELKVHGSKSARLVLIKNDPEVIKYINKNLDSYKLAKEFEHYNSGEFLEKLDIGSHALKEMDKVASVVAVEIANLPAFKKITEVTQKWPVPIDGPKLVYYTMRFAYVFLRVWAVVLNLEFVPMSWPYFVYILPLIPMQLINLVYGLITGNEQMIIDNLAIILSLGTAGVPTALALKKLKWKKAPYRMAEEWFVKNFKKYFLNPQNYENISKAFRKLGINAGNAGVKGFRCAFKKLPPALIKGGKFAPAKAALKSAGARVRPPKPKLASSPKGAAGVKIKSAATKRKTAQAAAEAPKGLAARAWRWFCKTGKKVLKLKIGRKILFIKQ